MTAGEKGYGKNSGKFSALLAICDIHCICIECMYCEKLNCITHAVAELHVWGKVQSHALWHHKNEKKYFFNGNMGYNCTYHL